MHWFFNLQHNQLGAAVHSPPIPLSYKVKIINPNKKSDFIVLTWHHMHDHFDSPKVLKLKLMESFSDFVPSDVNFHVGYFEGKASAKKWIVSSEDCNAMYDAHGPGDEITIWCDAKEKGASRKRKNDDHEAEAAPLTKREEREKEENAIFVKLTKKHARDKYTEPQLKLWARLIRTGAHSDLDDPPKVPLRPIKNSETDRS